MSVVVVAGLLVEGSVVVVAPAVAAPAPVAATLLLLLLLLLLLSLLLRIRFRARKKARRHAPTNRCSHLSSSEHAPTRPKTKQNIAIFPRCALAWMQLEAVDGADMLASPVMALALEALESQEACDDACELVTAALEAFTDPGAVEVSTPPLLSLCVGVCFLGCWGFLQKYAGRRVKRYAGCTAMAAALSHTFEAERPVAAKVTCLSAVVVAASSCRKLDPLSASTLCQSQTGFLLQCAFCTVWRYLCAAFFQLF